MDKLVLYRGVEDFEQTRFQQVFQAMRAESAQRDPRGGEQAGKNQQGA